MGRRGADPRRAADSARSHGGLGLRVKPAAAGVVWVSPTRLLVTNFFNDSVSLVDATSRKVVAEIDLRPGKLDATQRGRPGGTYPFRVAMAGPGRAVVSSPRDRELITLSIVDESLNIVARATTVAEPTALLALPDDGCSRPVTTPIR